MQQIGQNEMSFVARCGASQNLCIKPDTCVYETTINSKISIAFWNSANNMTILTKTSAAAMNCHSKKHRHCCCYYYYYYYYYYLLVTCKLDAGSF